MSWTETHRRWQALREIETWAEATGSDALPWSGEYAEIFGDPAGLAAALRYRWQLTVSAQLDADTPAELAERRRELRTRHAAILRILARIDRDGLPPANLAGRSDAPVPA